VDKKSSTDLVESLIQTSLRGVDSHGINLFPHYYNSFIQGRLNKRPDLKFTKTSATTFKLDADHSVGHYSASVAIKKAIQVAKKMGMASVSIKNSSHFGACAYFGLQAAAQDTMGFVFTNGNALVKAYNGILPYFGTNPVCITAPLEGEGPLCLDMATSLSTWNKIGNYKLANKSIPSEWAFDELGKPVTDPFKARSLSAIGLYKGFGLGMMFELLNSYFSGGPMSKDILSMYEAPLSKQRYLSHFVMVIDISKFVEIDLFKHRLQESVNQIRLLEPIDKEISVMVPGDPEKKSFKERIVSGIPIDEKKLEEYLKISKSFSNALIK
jgi:ureidoglycolate dehydrogenase (NAD+)